MFHALIILLHRPFVSEGHLNSVAKLAASDAFSLCETAAFDIDVVLRWYKARFCIKSPPYFISYATYASATIHVRTATQKPQGSKAHECLRNCLDILSEHEVVCRAPRRAKAILLGLIERLEVKIDVDDVSRASASCAEEGSGDTPGGNTTSWLEYPSTDLLLEETRGLDMENIMRSFNLTPAEQTQPSRTGTTWDEVPPTNIDCNALGQIDSELYPVSYDLENLLGDVSGGFDPLFGFDMPE